MLLLPSLVLIFVTIAELMDSQLQYNIVFMCENAFTANVGVPGLVYIMENSAKTPNSHNNPPGISGLMNFTSFFP